MKILVLAGGLSNERDVSLSSGSQIANALMSKGHDVAMLDLFFGHDEYTNFDELHAHTQKTTYDYDVPQTAPDLEQLKADKQSTSEIGNNVIPICKSADIVFVALHGGIGENGKLQAVFDVHGITYTGSGYKGSLIAMDKILSKNVMMLNDISTPEFSVITTSDGDEASINAFADNLSSDFPKVVKRNNSGSSIGVHIVQDKPELIRCIQSALLHSDNVMVEAFVAGREFSVAVLDNQPLPVIELIPKEGFYDYENKYQPDATIEITPAEIDDSITKEMQAMALKLHRLIGLSVYSRADFLLDNDNNIYCIEVNSLPGMTPTSLIPQEAQAAGIDYETLCNQIVELSLKK